MVKYIKDGGVPGYRKDHSGMSAEHDISNQVAHLVEKGEGYYLLEMYPEALGQADKALELDPNNFAAWYLRGECLREMKRFREALAALGKALWLNPKEMGPYIGIGWCWKRLGDLDRAIEILRDALKVRKDFPLTCYNLSCYLSLKNAKDEALSLLRKAISLDAQFARLCREEADFDNIRDLPEFSELAESEGRSQ